MDVTVVKKKTLTNNNTCQKSTKASATLASVLGIVDTVAHMRCSYTVGQVIETGLCITTDEHNLLYVCNFFFCH